MVAAEGCRDLRGRAESRDLSRERRPVAAGGWQESEGESREHTV
jgi:hypothetical protein